MVLWARRLEAAVAPMILAMASWRRWRRGVAPQALWWYACGRRGAEEAGKAWR